MMISKLEMEEFRVLNDKMSSCALYGLRGLTRKERKRWKVLNKNFEEG